MTLWLALAGFVVALLTGLGLGAAVLAAAVGAVAGVVLTLQRRVSRLERLLAPPEPVIAEPLSSSTNGPQEAPETIADPFDGLDDGVSDPVPDFAHDPGLSAAAAPRSTRPSPEILARALDALRAWFTTGNVPVKLGVLISFFGVAFLLKYAHEREILRLPLELRLAAVAAGGLALLLTGWRLRLRRPGYAQTLQGGGIGIMYLTLFAALRLYQLVPPALAFALMVLLAVAGGLLAVLQNARWLAWFSAVGGFAAPLLASTGSGDHITLFSYYLVLNLLVLGVARFRAWRELNLSGFLFTFAVGGAWGYANYEPELYASSQFFLAAFFLIYVLIALLYAGQTRTRGEAWLDGTLLFGTPIVAFGLQAELMKPFEYGLAISAMLLGALYVGLGFLLSRQAAWRNDRSLIEAFTALGIGFATLAIPLALDARWTAAAWALEGAGLVWLGVRQSRLLARLTGAGLQFAAGIAYFESAQPLAGDLPLLNGRWLGAALLSLAALASTRWLDLKPKSLYRFEVWLPAVLLYWGLAFWLYAGWPEIERLVSSRDQAACLVLFFAGSALLMRLAADRLRWKRIGAATRLLLPALAAIGLTQVFLHRHPLERFGVLAWPLAIAAQYWLLSRLRDLPSRADRWLQAGTVWLVAVLVAKEADWWLGKAASGDWNYAGAVLAPALILAILLLAVQRGIAPFARNPRDTLGISAMPLALASMAGIFMLAFSVSGSSAPLPYLPLLNPFDVAAVLILLIVLLWRRALQTHAAISPAEDRVLKAGMLLLVFALLTAAIIRTVHHWTDVPFRADALFQSVTVQGALSICWGFIALAAMLAGARRTQRQVWMTGAVLMAIVVAKLFLVDLGNSGSVARIVSFIGVGGLLLVVGFYAPAPPRPQQAVEAGE